MKIVNLVQGSPEWAAHRAKHFNASDASAMMACSPYKSRTLLLDEMSSGLVPEPGYFLQQLFDSGHRFEALARPLAEQVLGEELYPVVGVNGRLSASFDGHNMAGDISFEHKSLNQALREAFVRMQQEAGSGWVAVGAIPVGNDYLPRHYCVQMDHQCAVSGAEQVLFMASEWSEDGQLVEEYHCWYLPDAALRSQILAGWDQFEKDVAEFVPVPSVVKPAGAAPDTLPALLIQVTGAVTASNLPEFRARALAVFGSINRELTTDQHFADAEKTVKWCAEVERRLKAAKEHALSQTATIDELFKAIDDIGSSARSTRLELEKLVQKRKDELRVQVVSEGQRALRDHVAALNVRIGRPLMPAVPADFAGAVSGKRTVDTLRGAVSDELARAKIAANEVADLIQNNLRSLAEQAEFAFLFSDVDSLVLRPADHLAAVIQSRVLAHQEKEARRIEADRERIRAEEAAKAQAEVARAAAEARRIEADREMADVIARAASPAEAVPSVLVAPAEPAPAPLVGEDAPTLRLGKICQMLGLTISGEYLLELGFAPVGIQGAAKLYWVADFPRICDALCDRIRQAKQLALGDVPV
jgi:predicted phage-related endonuclease